MKAFDNLRLSVKLGFVVLTALLCMVVAQLAMAITRAPIDLPVAPGRAPKPATGRDRDQRIIANLSRLWCALNHRSDVARQEQAEVSSREPAKIPCTGR
jgi:hypothetical protein